MKKIFFLLFACCSLTAFIQPPAYKNKNLSPEQRAKDFLSRTTLDEKLMPTCSQKAQVLDSNGNFNEPPAFKNLLPN